MSKIKTNITWTKLDRTVKLGLEAKIPKESSTIQEYENYVDDILAEINKQPSSEQKHEASEYETVSSQSDGEISDPGTYASDGSDISDNDELDDVKFALDSITLPKKFLESTPPVSIIKEKIPEPVYEKIVIPEPAKIPRRFDFAHKPLIEFDFSNFPTQLLLPIGIFAALKFI